jgi:D-alanyl-D-alanine carboxypeptidase
MRRWSHPESAQADFAIFQRRIHSLQRTPPSIARLSIRPSESLRVKPFETARRSRAGRSFRPDPPRTLGSPMSRTIPLRRLLLLPALAVSTAAAAQPATVVDPSLAPMDSMLAAAYPAAGPGAAVIVARGGQVLLRKAYGTADLELGVPMRTDHVFRVGSITKQFTAVAILMLMEEGKLSLDDEITRFWPDYPTHGRRITVEHLLTHTSGIHSYTEMPEWRPRMLQQVTPAELIAIFRDQPMDFAPGEDWHYNNSGYALLGAVVEQVSGQPWGDFLRTRIFQPLGMRDTRYEAQGDVIPRRIPGYAKGQDGAIRNADPGSVTHAYAAGAIRSTVDDLLRWQLAVERGELLRPETWRRAHQPYRLADGRGTGYGFGWFVARTANRPSIEHGGDINGFSSNGLWIPSERLHVIVLSNAERNFADPDDLSQEIARTVLGAGDGYPPVATMSAEALDDFTGVYRISASEARVVTREGTTLYSQRGRSTKQELRSLGGNDFVFPGTGTRLTFIRGTDGRVTAMQLRPRLGPDEVPAMRSAEAAEAVTAVAPPVAVAAEVLDAYVGQYELAPEFILTVRREGAGLRATATGQPEVTLLARSDTRFDIQEVTASVDFQRDAAGAVTGLILHQGGRDLPARKIR